jgi:uncharacterized protein (UPF0548 family)
MRSHATPVLAQYHQRPVVLKPGGTGSVATMAIVGAFRSTQITDDAGVRMVEQGSIEVVATDGLSIGMQDVIEVDAFLYDVIESSQPKNGFIYVTLQRLLTHEMSRYARGGR